MRPLRAKMMPASSVNNVPIFRLPTHSQQTLRLPRPGNPPVSHVSHGLASPHLRQALTSSISPGTSSSPRLVLRTLAPEPPPTLPQPSQPRLTSQPSQHSQHSQPSQPIIVSVASLAPSPSPTEQFVCPGYPYKCKDPSLKTRSKMIRHWTMDHFYNNIDKMVYGLQSIEYRVTE